MGVLIAILIEIIISFIFKDVEVVQEALPYFFNVINTIILIIWTSSRKKLSSTQRKFLIGAILVRMAFLFVNHFYPLSFAHNTADADLFHKYAIEVSNNLSLLSSTIYGGIYTKILGLLYHVTGPNRFFVEGLNSILSIAAIYNIFASCQLLKLEENNKTKFLYFLLTFLPQGILYSFSIRREALIVYLVSVSLKYIIKYINDNKKKDFIISALSLLFAAPLHAGVLFLICGYIFFVSFYNRDKKKLVLNIKKLFIFTFLSLSLLFVYTRYGEVIAPKISNVSEEKIISSFERQSKGGSAYLGGKEITSTKDYVVYLIPKYVYFLFSPMIWDARGASDIIAILTDSLIYLYLFYNIFVNIKYLKGKEKSIAVCLLLGALISILVFCIGTSNSGTAMRHRFKLFEYLVFINIICSSQLRRMKNEKKKCIV